MNEDGGSDGGCIVRPPFDTAAGQTEHPLEIGDSTLDSGAKALGVPEEGIGLTLFLFFGAFALLVDGHEVDLFAQRCKLLAAAVVAFVRGEFPGVVPEEFPVSLDGRFEKFMLDGLMGEHVVMGNELLLHLLDLDHVAKLDGLAGLASYEQLGMRLKGAEELLAVGYLPAFDDALMGLLHDLIGKTPEVDHLPNALGDQVPEHVGIGLPCDLVDRTPDDVLTPQVELVDQHDKLRIEGFEDLLAGFGISGLATTRPCDLLYDTFYLAALKSPAVHEVGVQRAHPLDQTGQGPVAIAQQGRVGGPVDVGLHGRGVQADTITGDVPLIDGRLAKCLVDFLPSLRIEAVSEPTERGIIDHGVVVDPHEAAEELAIVDTHNNLPQGAALDTM